MSDATPAVDYGTNCSADGTVAVTFHPQGRVDSPGGTHDWDGPYYVTVNGD